MNGDDWAGVDATGKPWMCLTGRLQSPINVPTYHVLDGQGKKVPKSLHTKWSYPTIVSNGSNVEVINNGHTIQIEWLYPYAADVSISVPAEATNSTPITAVLGMHATDNATTVSAVPLQFHFHTSSEHLLSGHSYPLELHIVHRVTGLPACAAAGCYTVTGILFEVVNGPDNPLLKAIWDVMPLREGTINYLEDGAKIPLGDLLPDPADRTYVTYEGSLTTPPCTEGLLWHVMTHPRKISLSQWRKYKKAVGMKDCTAKATTTSTDDPSHHHHHHHRRLLEEEPAGNPDDYVCKVVAYGTNYRMSQYNFDRVVKIADAA